LKQAYISLILPFSAKMEEPENVIRVDSVLQATTSNHEIILISAFDSNRENFKISGLTGPLSIINTNVMSSENSQRVAALGRAAGDFIIEWHGDFNLLTERIILELLEPTSNGFELIEFESSFQSKTSRLFYRLVNSLRSSKIPIRKTVARAFSRRALGQLLSASSFEPQIDLLFAELPIRRITRFVEVNFAAKQNLKDRVTEGVTLLAKGSRFGTVVPLILATISAAFGVLVALYAFALYAVRGESPAGWTSLMIVTGFGQASILALIGMTWARIDSLVRGLSRPNDATANVFVYPPER